VGHRGPCPAPWHGRREPGLEKLWTWAWREEETRFLAEQLSTAHRFDQRETRELLDWVPEVTLDEGLARLAEHYGSRSASRGRRS
jgi:2-alkyl-3-oxoalkanoate reductase